MNPTALVTVIIPSYDTPEAFLGACLQSLIGQTMLRWEAIVVDDASVNGDVAGLVSSFADARFRVIRHAENRGEGAARNTGVRAAQTDLVISLDADDMMHPDALGASRQALLDHSDADWVLTDRQLFGTSTDILRWPVPLPPLCPAHFNAGSPGMIRRQVWEAVGGYSEESLFRAGGVDLDFWISAVEKGFKPIHVARPLYCYRIPSQSTSDTSFAYNQHLIHEAIYRRHRSLFDSFSGDCQPCRQEKRVPAYLSHAYVRSSEAARARGERLRAFRLALRGFSLHPGDRKVRRQLVRSLVPKESSVGFPC